MSDTLRVISLVGALGWNLYFWPSAATRILPLTGRDAPDIFRTLRAELRPFGLMLVVLMDGPKLFGDPSAWTYLTIGCDLFCWFMYRNPDDDDDRWKRRKQKLADKVAEVGGRLQVVPAGAA